MALVSKKPFTDMAQTCTRFASTLPAGCQRLLLLLAPRAAGSDNVLQGNPFLPLLSQNHESLCQNTVPHSIKRRRCLSLAGARQVLDKPRAWEREPGANTLRKVEVWLLLAEMFQDHLVSSWLSATPQDPTCNCNAEHKAARRGLWGRHRCWGGK